MLGFLRRATQEKTDRAVAKTRGAWFTHITSIFAGGRLDDETWEELEELLVAADVGAATAQELIGRVRQLVRDERAEGADGALAILKREMAEMLAVDDGGDPMRPEAGRPAGRADGRRERRREDDGRGEAGAPLPGAGQEGAARGRGHVPRGRHRPAPGVGPAPGRRRDRPPAGLRRRGRRVRRRRGRVGARGRRSHRRHGGPSPHEVQPDGGGQEGTQGSLAARPRGGRRRSCSRSTPPPARTVCCRPAPSPRRSSATVSSWPSWTARPRAGSCSR